MVAQATLKRESELRDTKAHLEAELAKAYESVASEVEKLKRDASNTSSTAAIEIQDMQDQMQQLDGELQDSLKVIASSGFCLQQSGPAFPGPILPADSNPNLHQTHQRTTNQPTKQD